MPNHCENDLYISGNKSDIDALLLHIGMYRPDPKFDFNTLIPYPEPYKSMDDDAESFMQYPGLDDPERAYKLAAMKEQQATYAAKWGTISDGYNCGGYEWCIANWGTKWNAYDVARRDYDRRVCVTFQTAWAPPTPVIIALAKCFPNVTLTLEYFECGMGFAGGFQCPSEDDYHDEDKCGPWKPAIVTCQWEVKGYRGVRGG